MESSFFQIEQYVDDAIELELAVSELYLEFFHKFRLDADFWWELCIEEKNHAAALKNIKLVSGMIDRFPAELLPDQPDIIKKAIRKVDRFKADINKILTRKEALLIALDIEKSASEKHLQLFCNIDCSIKELKPFQKLACNGKDHAKRIINYMIENNLIK